MAEPLDYFFQGANLGMRAGEFRTNLSERARQFNEELAFRREANKNAASQFRAQLAEDRRQFDAKLNLDEIATNAVAARNTAEASRVQYQLTQDQEQDERLTKQLDTLRDYKTLIRSQVENNVIDLALPPANLEGAAFEEGKNFRDNAEANRANKASYLIEVKERNDLSDLIANYGLRSDFVEYFKNYEAAKEAGVPYTAPGFNRSSLIPPGSRPLFTPEEENPANELKEAFTRRSLARAEVIASEYGVDPMKVSTIDVISPFQDQKGDLDVDRFRAYVSALPEAKMAVSSVTTYPDGRSQKTMRQRSGSSDDNISKLERFMKAAEPLITRKTTGFAGTQETLNIPALKSLADQFGIQLTDEIISALSSSSGGGGGGGDDFVEGFKNFIN